MLTKYQLYNRCQAVRARYIEENPIHLRDIEYETRSPPAAMGNLRSPSGQQSFDFMTSIGNIGRLR